MTAATTATARIDRRLDQRGDCLKGLARWLESARRMLEIDSLALADPSGCLVVGAGSARRCEEMAAVAPLFQANSTAKGLRITPVAAGAAWLCAPNHPERADDWLEITRGCLRILGWTETS